jgi:hypothetical protein
MDNMTDEQLNTMVDLLADKLVKRIYGTQERDSDMMWYAEDEGDHMVGELARLMTLLNLYEEREEYEKCHLINKHITRVTKIVENL